MNRKHRSLLLILLFVLVVTQIRPVMVQGAMPELSRSHYMKTYVLSNSEKTCVYTDKSLKVRGTSSPYKKYKAVFAAGNEIRVYAMKGKWAYISYLSSSGRSYGYIKRSDITTSNFSQEAEKSRGKIKAYKRPGAGKYGSIAEGATVYTIASAGEYKQVIYPAGSAWRMGWIKGDAYEKYVEKITEYLPQGWFDSVASDKSGEITVEGWAFDRDKLGTSLEIHVYVGGPAGSGAPGYRIKADTSRPDVDAVYPGVGKNHGFSSTIQVDRTGTQTVYVYAINVAGGDTNPLLGAKSVTIKSSEREDAEEEKRAAAVKYMKKMASVKWTPSKIITYWSGGQKWYPGTYYYGIPYSQSTRTTNLELFQSYLSGFKYVGPSGQRTYKGSDCSSAVSMAWKKVNSDFYITNTTGMYPCNGQTKTVGSYEAGTSVNASYICTKNGKNTMYKAYKGLQKGDAVLRNGHVMLVSGVGKNYIYVTHQTVYNSSLHSTWRIDTKWTYSQLFENGYIPITLADW